MMNNSNRWDNAKETKVGCLELFENRDGNGIILAPMCKGDGDDECFASSNDKQYDHTVTTVKLDEVGDYLVFPSRFQDFITVDIIRSLPTRPIILHNYFARQQKVEMHGKM
jgi:hypothetical protein